MLTLESRSRQHMDSQYGLAIQKMVLLPLGKIAGTRSPEIERYIHIAWSAPFLKTFENMRKLDYFRLPGPRCISTAAGAGSLK